MKTVRHTVNRDCMWYNPPHEKQEWKLIGKNKWRWKELTKHIKGNPKFMESVNVTAHEGLSKGKMRSIRRKQFFAFFEGFFDTHNKDSLKMKSANLSFSEEEKAGLLKKYFKKYFNEKLDLKKSPEEVKIEEEGTMSTLLNAS